MTTLDISLNGERIQTDAATLQATTGKTLITGGIVAVLLAGLIAFGWRIRVEDAAMTARFSDEHVAYRRRKAALIPYLW